MTDEPNDNQPENNLVPVERDPRIDMVMRNIDSMRQKRHTYQYGSVGYNIVQGKYNQEHWKETLHKYESMLTTPELLNVIQSGHIPYVGIMFLGNPQLIELPDNVATIIFDTEVRASLSAIKYYVDKDYGIFRQMARADNLQLSINDSVPQYNPNFLPSIEARDLENYLVRKVGENDFIENLEIPELLKALHLTEKDLVKIQQLKQLAIRSAVMFAINTTEFQAY